ncbi:MAG TPA: AAA family ATPase [Thermoleophilia bacterium]|nr:AAA family ATPase [Thermoleophilia bacterium]
MTPFPFGRQFQQGALRLMLEDEAYCALATTHFQVGFFENAALSWTFGVVHGYYAAYSRPPTPMVLHEELRKLDPAIGSQYRPTIEAVTSPAPIEVDYIRDQTVEFVRRNLFVQRFEHARQLYNQGNTSDAYDFWQRSAEEINQVTLKVVDRSWFFEDLDDRQKRRAHYASAQDYNTFPTGIDELDRVLNGGLSIGELGAWIAYQKVGKSMLLTWLAYFAVRALQAPVLVTIHEGGREYWEDRLEAAFAHMFTSLISRNELTVESHAALVEEYRGLRRLCVVRGFTKEEESWNATVLDLDKELKDLRVQGFRPRMIVIDYADLLRSRDRADNETAHQTAAWRDVKTLAGRDNGYAIWTAAQAQRKNPKADRDPNFFVRAENVSDAAGKVRVPDFYGSINRTREEEETNRVRLLAEDYRSGMGGRVIELETDYAHGRFVKSVLASRAAPPAPVELV